MHVAVAIVGFRNAPDIARCLEALSYSSYQDFEVIICENGGAKAVAALAETLSEHLVNGQAVQLLDARGNLGFAGGVNLCLRKAGTADAWWVLNPDTIPKPMALELMVKRMLVGDCEAVGSTVHLFDGRVQSYGCYWTPWLARAVSIGQGTSPENPVEAASIERQQNYLNGASMLIGRKFVETVGEMREDYFLYCEEVEWCLRGLSKGMRLGCALDAVVVHEQGATTGAGTPLSERSRLPIFLGERNKILLTWDRYPALIPIAALTSLAIWISRVARDSGWNQLSVGLSGWMAGLLNRREPPEWLKAMVS